MGLELPSMVIGAFRAQIFLLDHQADGRATASPQSWKEDMQWSRRLDFGWDLGKVKQVSKSPLSALRWNVISAIGSKSLGEACRTVCA